MPMEARNRKLLDWFSRIRTGQLRLPRLQRGESWSHKEVGLLLESVVRGRPVGAALVLEVGDTEPFVSRPMAGAPKPSERASEYLFDGQQRLTALWKALNDQYDDRTYFVVLHPGEEEEDDHVKGVRTQKKNGQRYPLWVDDPNEQLSRGLAPLNLLNPERNSGEILSWCKDATDSLEDILTLQARLHELQKSFDQANIPFLELTVGTPPPVAVDVFVKMNTTSVQLTAFDIAVAQLEAKRGESLHDMVESLRKKEAPSAERYYPLTDLVLMVAVLRENRPPVQSSIALLDLNKFSEEWEDIVRGIKGAIEFLEQERIFDRQRLPTIGVVPVLAGIWSQMPQALDGLGQGRTLLRKYLWRSFFTERYDKAAANAALQDYRGLRALVLDGKSDASVPVFDEKEFPIVQVEELVEAPWPKSRDTLARATLAVSLRGGGRDFADDGPITSESLQKREYHHLFPAALLSEDGSLDEDWIDVALNCALVTWNTNRTISAKEPVAYLRERVEGAIGGEAEIRRRLNSHTIPFKELKVGGYASIGHRAKRRAQVRKDYFAFIDARAEAVHAAVVKLCNGEEWQGL